MKIRGNASDAANELRVELKYCERCGGLWLRALGVAEVYCAGCGREMDEMPPISYEDDGAEEARTLRGLQWIMADSGLESIGDYGDLDFDATEGVA